MTRRASSGERTALELSDRLLAEAVRAFEQDGSRPLRDRTAEAAGRRAGGDFEHRIVTRARSLDAAEQFADALRRVRQVTGLVVMLGAVFALVAGAATVRAALGAERAGSVNIYWVIGGVLGVQTLLLVGWLVLSAVSARVPRAGATATGIVGAGAGWLGAATMALARWLVRRVHRDPHHLAAIESVGGVWARGAIGRWTLGSISHGLWLAFSVGCLVLAVLLLSTKDYTFTWETTILSAESYERLTGWIGYLPGTLGFETPTPEQIEASRAPVSRDQAAVASGAWSGLLLGSIVVYGLLPRLLLFLFCLSRRRRAFQRFRLDLARPGHVRLRPILMSDHESISVEGADLDLDEREGIVKYKDQRGHEGECKLATFAKTVINELSPEMPTARDEMEASAIVKVNPTDKKIRICYLTPALAEPLIEAWMVENRGPEARTRNAIQDLGQTLERLPRLAAEAERLASDLAAGGLRLHPDSLKAMGGDAGRSARWAFWIALAALAVALLAV